MIAELAYTTGHLPSEWANEDPIDIVTMIEIIRQQQKQQRKQDRKNRAD